MPSTGRIIQFLILFSTALGVVFLSQVYGVVPAELFDFVAIGWVLFVLDSIFTFTNPRVSYYMGFVLAVLTLVSSLPESAHYALVENGVLLPAATFVLGSVAQVLLVLLVPYHFIRERRRAG